MLAFATVSLGLVASAIATTFNVSVGTLDDKNIFTPTSVKAASGDTVLFVFFDPGDHTATQSSFATPCAAKSGGVDSGTKTTNGTTFSYTVTSTDPVWFYCATGTHCKQGMVFAINPTTSETFDTFQKIAKGAIKAPAAASSAVSSASAVTTLSSAGAAAGSSTRIGSSTSSTAPSSSASSSAANTFVVGSFGLFTAIAAIAALL